jgi:biotin carboxyl carrier protein
MKYVVTIGGEAIEVEVDGNRVTVAGRTRVASLGSLPGTPIRHLVLDGRLTTLAAKSGGGGRWALTARGELWDVEVIDERTRYIRSLAGAGGAGPQQQRYLVAPMPGLVVRVPVTMDDQVAAGASLVVLEAMKMENELRAPAAATVRAVLVQPGQTVEKGQKLVELA